MFTCTVAAYISCPCAFFGDMIPALTPKASGGFPFDPFDMAFLFTDLDSICDSPVGNIWVSKQDDKMCRPLLGPVLFHDPPDLSRCTQIQADLIRICSDPSRSAQNLSSFK